jgi:glycosyltransferase involved in cell wall biosynthesis
MARLVYVVQSEMYTGGVIESQVVAAMRARSEIPGHPESKIVFLEPHQTFRRSDRRIIMGHYRNMWPTGNFAVAPFVGRWPTSPSLALRSATLSFGRGRDLLLVHARGPEATLTGHHYRRHHPNSRLIFDSRGHSAFEALFRLQRANPSATDDERKFVFEKALALDQRAAAVADHVVGVAPGLCRYIVEDLGKDPSDVTEIPNGIERLSFSQEARLGWRRKWGIDDDAVVVMYSGRMGAERCPELMVAMFRSLQRRVPNARLVVLTYLNETAEFHALLRRYDVDPALVVLTSLSRDESVDALSAGDMGVLFLEDAPRFTIAAPIKFAEYLAAGLRVVLTPGDLATIVESRGLGWVIPHSSNPEVDASQVAGMARFFTESTAADRTEARDRALSYCADRYLWSNMQDKLLRAYGLDRRQL